MNKTRILGIGIGQAGNILLNEFLERDKRYTGLFINSAYDDMSSLEHFDYEKNCFAFPGEFGSGRDRSKAKIFVKDNLTSLSDIFLKYPLQDVVVVFFSTDGGTGSGTAPMILQILRKACPNKKINVVAVLPNPEKSDELSLRNCLECCNELSKIRNLIDDIKFIDNSKENNYTKINKKAIDDLNNAFSINGKHQYGNIDMSDSKRVNTAKGYGLILNLNDNMPSTTKAIDDAINSTVFALPDNYNCDYLAISVKENQYNIDELKNHFKATKTTYNTYNEKFNLLVFGGCSAPNESLEYIKLKLDEIKDINKKLNTEKKTAINIDIDNLKEEDNSSKNNQVKTVMSEEEFEGLIDDLENLFDN